MKTNQEIILCAAIYYNDGEKYSSQPENVKTGFVVCGLCHAGCMEILLMIINHVDNFDKLKTGFLTNHNRFVDRKEGYRIAYKQDQLLKDIPRRKPDRTTALASEDLY
jgi:hypothetical protein